MAPSSAWDLPRTLEDALKLKSVFKCMLSWRFARAALVRRKNNGKNRTIGSKLDTIESQLVNRRQRFLRACLPA